LHGPRRRLPVLNAPAQHHSRINKQAIAPSHTAKPRPTAHSSVQLSQTSLSAEHVCYGGDGILPRILTVTRLLQQNKCQGFDKSGHRVRPQGGCPGCQFTAWSRPPPGLPHSTSPRPALPCPRGTPSQLGAPASCCSGPGSQQGPSAHLWGGLSRHRRQHYLRVCVTGWV
jgi:hypothetical protein